MSSQQKNRIRLAAIADLHCRENMAGAFRDLFARVSAEADVLALCGDLTDHGQVAQARVLAEDIRAALRIPAVGVFGNHDVESEQAEELYRIFTDAGIQMLDGEAVEVHGIGFAGTKGFCGGFGRGMLQPWGERVIKDFVQEAVSEALKLESGLARLRSEQRVALLHYAPVHDTVEGEHPEIVPFLGSTRLMEPIDAFGASLVLHGHCHYGSLEGRTAAGIPVYNCALPLRRRHDPERPFVLVEVAAPAPVLPESQH